MYAFFCSLKRVLCVKVPETSEDFMDFKLTLVSGLVNFFLVPNMIKFAVKSGFLQQADKFRRKSVQRRADKNGDFCFFVNEIRLGASIIIDVRANPNHQKASLIN